MNDSAESRGDTHPTVSERSQNRTAGVDALTPESPPRGVTYFTLLMSLLSVGTGIALFTVGDAPTGSPVPLLSVVFIAAGILIWSGAALERQTERPETAP